MGDIVALTDLKTRLRITASGTDAELNQMITSVERRFQGEIGQRALVQTTYTSEKYTGDGTPLLYLRNYPLQSITTPILVESEGDVVTTAGESTSTVIRFRLGADSNGVLELLARVWPKYYPNNITVTYSAGYVAGTIATDIPDVWELLIDSAAQMYLDMDTRRAKVASQSYMQGAVAYFDPIVLGKGFVENRWRPVVQAHMRRRKAAA